MTAPAPRRSPHLTRRRFLALGATAAAVGALAACTPTPAWVSPTGAAVDRTERGRGGTGRVGRPLSSSRRLVRTATADRASEAPDGR